MTMQETRTVLLSFTMLVLVANLGLMISNGFMLRRNAETAKLLREKTAELQGYIDHARDHPEVIPCTQGMTLMPGQMCQFEIHPGEDEPIREPEKPEGQKM